MKEEQDEDFKSSAVEWSSLGLNSSQKKEKSKFRGIY